MKIWQQLRIPVLATTFGGVVLVLGTAIVAKTPQKNVAETPFEFPATVPLPGWTLRSQSAWVDPSIQQSEHNWGHQYEYDRDGLNLEIAMLYVDHPHLNEKLFRKYDPRLPSPPEIPPTLTRETVETGSYSLSVRDDRAYLRSCINPRGPGAIFYEAFIKNRYTYDLQLSRLLPVLSGKEPLRDHRCFWTHISLPLQNTDPEQVYPVLEDVWVSWYQWWHPRFPKP